MSLDQVLDRIDADLPDALDRLMELLRIQSISTDPAFADHCVTAADWLANDLKTIGFQSDRRDTPGHPMVVGHGGEGDRHLLFYGHYDVQPVDRWTSGTTTPSPRLSKTPPMARSSVPAALRTTKAS